MTEERILQELKNGTWIGAEESYDAPVITRVFEAHGVRSATLLITGLGYFEAFLNGKKTTQDCFLPVVSHYEPRDLTRFLYPISDQIHIRIYGYAFDVTPLVKEGENRLDIWLGNGFYRQEERVCEGPVSFGRMLKTAYCLRLEGADGTRLIASDGTETQRDSHIRQNCLFIGETVDFTCPLAPPSPVKVVNAPAAQLSPAIGTPDRLIRRIVPTLLGERNGVKVFDTGENVSGVVRIAVTAPYGSRTVLRFAEECRDDLTLDFDSAGAQCIGADGRQQIMEDVFVSDGQTRVFQPRFVWHAFRYFEIDGPFDQAEVCVIHADVPVTADFHSTLEGPQFLYDSFIRSMLCNMHGSYPSDCPHRERLGYTGDGQVCAPAAMMTLDCRAFYEKWIQDILDCQDPVTGHVQHTAPFMGGGGGPGVWGSAIVLVPYAHAMQYGSTRQLEKCYEPMVKWIGYLQSRCEDGVIVREEKDGWCLGDWCTLEPIRISAAYVNTCWFAKVLERMEQIAIWLGHAQDQKRFAALRHSTLQAIRCHFYEEQSGHFDVGVQGADAYAVWCGAAGAETARQVAQFYAQLGHFDTGFAGTDMLLQVLFDHGYGSVALQLLESRELGSFLYMKQHGATTVWENWNGAESHNHPMFAAAARHLFTGILGLAQRPGTMGWQDVVIRPCRLERGQSIRARLCTPAGVITAQLDGDMISVEAPADMRITFAQGVKYSLKRL